MCVPVSELSAINLGWIDFRELYFSFWWNSHQFYASPQSEFFQSGSQAIVDYNCIGIKRCSSDTCVELASAFLHTTNYVDHWSHLSELKFIKHFSNW